MPAEWPLSVVVQISTDVGDIVSSSYYRAVKFLGHGMMVVVVEGWWWWWTEHFIEW